jgi:hypothetical protein
LYVSLLILPLKDPTKASTYMASVTNYGYQSSEQLMAGNAVASYPCEGSVAPWHAHGAETPDPIPGRDWNSKPGGTPVLFSVRAGQVIALNSFTLKDQAGNIIPIAAMLTASNDPNKTIQPHQAVAIPDMMLTRGATYFVEASGTNNGLPWTQKFKFSVAATAPQ